MSYQIFRTQPRGKLRRCIALKALWGRVVRWSDGESDKRSGMRSPVSIKRGRGWQSCSIQESRSKRLRCSDMIPVIKPANQLGAD